MKKMTSEAHSRSSGRSRPALATGAMLLLLLQLCVATAFAAITDPEYTKPILDPALQPKFTAAQTIPNALMPAFTFTPYTDLAAQAAGFPAGVCGVSEDCYSVEIRQAQQNLGIVDEVTGLPLSTTIWGYGSSTNAPTVGPFTAGLWHAPAMTFKNTSNRPTRVQWLNQLPNVQPPGFDPTYDCGMDVPDCYPYNRAVVHVHGAHVNADSDGNPNAWFTPNFLFNGPMYQVSPYGPLGTYRYINTQEAGTIWYHDHAMGTTHLNVNMGMAGFFLITDNNEKCLQGTVVPGCAVPVKTLPVDPYEVGFALQDRTFWPDGSFAMPDQPIRDLASPTCVLDVTGAPIPETCPLVQFSKAPDGHLIPFNPAIADTFLRGPFTAGNGSLEFMGNMPMVNGVVYGKYDAEPRVYRMRFIGGTDSRAFVMRLVRRDTGAIIPFWQIGTDDGLLPNPVLRYSMDLMPGERIDALVDFTGIPVGTKVVMMNFGPDAPYQGVNPVSVPPPPAGTALPVSTVMPELMEFNLITLNAAIPDVAVKPTVPAGAIGTGSNIDGFKDVAINLRPVSGAIAPLVTNAPVRNVSLIEITDRLGRVLPTLDGRGFSGGNPMIMGSVPGISVVPTTERVKLNDVEEWDIINTTADAHPMHLHLVSFQVIDRQPFINFVPPVTDTLNGLYAQPSYTPTGVATPAAPWEAGWKDTITCPPGLVTRVKAKFDIAGLYVWHCHILSHEEHDMMRPLIVSAAPSYTITAAAGANGTVAGAEFDHDVMTPLAAGAATVGAGNRAIYTFTPAAGFEVDAIVVDGVVTQSTALAPLTSYKFLDVQANHYINVYFKPIPNTVTVGVAANGTVTGGVPGANLVSTGTSFTVNFVPNAGFEVDAIVVDGVVTASTDLAPLTGYTFANVVANHYINVYFRAVANTITVGVGAGGTVTGAVVGANPLATGGTLNIAFVPAAGQQVSGIVVDGVLTLNDPAAPLTGYIFTSDGLSHYINVYFEPIPAAQSFTINAATSDPDLGTITAAAPAPAAPGPYAQASTVIFNITPAAGRTLAGIVVDGTFLAGPRASFTFTNVQANHYINAYFQ
jgi:FtsP/CotA-like multicopper oxidase with cupredoxin domain